MSKAQDADPVVTFDWTAFDSPSTAVATAIAEEVSVDPVAIEPLYEVIDPDAVDNLIASTSYPRGSPETSIEFSYQEYRVLVKATGRGYIYDQDDTSRSAPEPRQFEASKQAD